ncbi:PepSY-associated TM helix domain-containing protein [Sphingosinicella sp. LHD-64]|uniref:PepSY-associated TM helix domain-containing protein n=1 Tax=Sphingosinicella sp. LHD-64 TaxID=3072139 RepID=UPI00280EB71A|nr:PepSY-associated TM helix domain-containing protein [Sphingosinicella sp. LHD-64]MDQ8754632.1 PepSY-associated TM helix domain-containing protein [Sphingosinicella sp. LHD-64]
MNADSGTARAPAKRKAWIPADFVRAVLKGHSLLGLAFAAAIYLVCLTGTVAVFAREFQRWENPAIAPMTAASPEAVQTALSQAVARAGPGVEHVYMTLPGAELPWLLVTTDVAGRTQSWAADESGRITESAASPWTDFLTALHINLHLPRSWGIFLVGLTGVALLSSLISGLFAHPRIFRDAFHLRLGGSRRLQEADLHNRIGVWALPFHVLVSLTGALLGLTTIIVGVLGLALFQGDVNRVYDLFVPPHPADNPEAAPLLDLRPMFAQVAERAPGGRVEYVFLEHPTEMGGAALFNVDDGSSNLTNVDAYAFDRTGRLYHASPARENNLGEQILGALGTLHFGWFGGGIIKLAYGLLGLGLTYLAAGGVFIWLARRRDKGRAAPGLERLWTAVVWGQPLALAASAVAVILIGGAGAHDVTVALPLAVWGGVTLACLAAATVMSPVRLSGVGRGASGALLVVVVLAHAALAGGRTADMTAWAVNGWLMAIGLLLLATVLKRPTTNSGARR